jgi:SAM-dependent methyltransferase
MSSKLNKLRPVLQSFVFTPLHPQWLMNKWRITKRRSIVRVAIGNLLDIGCGRQQLKAQLPSSIRYIGIDYPETSINWYRKAPDVYGDAHLLPFESNTFDTVLLLDVLEHLKQPGEALEEAVRVMKDHGALVISVPFLYPIHDAPRDYMRWTEYGLSSLCDNAALRIVELMRFGRPIETAGLNMNLAIALSIRQIVSRSLLGWLLVPFAALIIFCINLLCWLLGRISLQDSSATAGYLIIATRR